MWRHERNLGKNNMAESEQSSNFEALPEDDSCSGQLENDGDWLPMDSEEDGASLSFRAIRAAHSYYVSLSSGSTPDEGPDLQEFIEGICQELETDPVQEESLIKRFRKKIWTLLSDVLVVLRITLKTNIVFLARIHSGDNQTIHIINYEGRPLVTSSEISALFWDSDMLRSQVRLSPFIVVNCNMHGFLCESSYAGVHYRVCVVLNSWNSTSGSLPRKFCLTRITSLYSWNL